MNALPITFDLGSNAWLRSRNLNGSAPVGDWIHAVQKRSATSALACRRSRAVFSRERVAPRRAPRRRCDRSRRHAHRRVRDHELRASSAQRRRGVPDDAHLGQERAAARGARLLLDRALSLLRIVRRSPHDELGRGNAARDRRLSARRPRRAHLPGHQREPRVPPRHDGAVLRRRHREHLSRAAHRLHAHGARNHRRGAQDRDRRQRPPRPARVSRDVPRRAGTISLPRLRGFRADADERNTHSDARRHRGAREPARAGADRRGAHRAADRIAVRRRAARAPHLRAHGRAGDVPRGRVRARSRAAALRAGGIARRRHAPHARGRLAADGQARHRPRRRLGAARGAARPCSRSSRSR